MPLEPIIGKSETVPAEYEAPPTMAEYKALVALETVAKYYAHRSHPAEMPEAIKLYVYTALGVGVGIVMGMLLGELIF